MGGKVYETKFTIQFSKTDPSHMQVVEILNRQGRRSKAQYIVNAVLHFERYSETHDAKSIYKPDIKVIEAVVSRLLQNKNTLIPTPVMEGDAAAVEKSAVDADEMNAVDSEITDEMNFDEAVESLGSNGFDAVAATLDLFRKK